MSIYINSTIKVLQSSVDINVGCCIKVVSNGFYRKYTKREHSSGSLIKREKVSKLCRNAK